MVIQCPSCNTKFSVDSGKVRGMSNPRFHCSRCDHFFDLWGRTKRRVGQTPMDAAAREPDESSPEQLELLPSAATEAGTPAFYETIGVVPFQPVAGEDDDLPLITAEWPDASSDTLHEADMREVIRRFHTDGQAPLSADDEQRFDTESVAPSTAAPVIETRTELLSSAPSDLPPPAATDPVGRRSVDTAPPSVVHFPRRKVERLQPAVEEEFHQLPLAPVRARSALRATAPLLTALSVPVVFLLFFIGWSQYLAFTPRAIGELLSLSPQEFPRVAPSGLQITAVESQRVTLDDGHEVLEIRGRFLNATPKVYDGIRIEGRLYDDLNRPLGRILVDSPNSLDAVGLLSSLRREVLAGFQGQREMRPPIRSAEEIPFRFVFTEKVDEANFFSARIYSVTPTKG